MAWIYQEFANAQNYDVTGSMVEDQHSGGGGGGMNSYDETLTRLLAGVLSRPDQREGLFSRLVLESPNITTNAIQILKNYCQDEVCSCTTCCETQKVHRYCFIYSSSCCPLHLL